MFGLTGLIIGSHSTAQTTIPNHKATVTAARATYNHLSGRQRAYCVVNKVSYDLRAENFGTFYKTGDNSYAQRSSDVIIVKPGGETFDILGDAEGSAVPQWGRTSPSGFGPVANWRIPADPATILAVCPQVTDPPIDPPDPPSDLTALTARVTVLEVKLDVQGQTITALQTDLAALGARVTALEHQPPTPPPAGGCTVQVVQTSTTAFHSHAVKTCLP